MNLVILAKKDQYGDSGDCVFSGDSVIYGYFGKSNNLCECDVSCKSSESGNFDEFGDYSDESGNFGEPVGPRLTPFDPV